MPNVALTAIFSTPGTFVWTCPTGVTSVTAVCWGGGGAGGDSGGTSGSNGGGGGGGECGLEPALAVTPSISYTGTVGAGGPSSTPGVQNGTDTSFTGDAVTVVGHGGGGGGLATAASGQHGAGGTGSSNTVSADGGPGDDGTVSTNGGGGGGAGGANLSTGFPGNAGSGSAAGGASGGLFPGGAGGAGSTSGAGPGAAGVAPGGGGGGGLSTGTARTGGSGANGQVTITWTMTDPIQISTNTGGGSYSFTAPPGAATVTAQAWGGGAGGFLPSTPGGGTIVGRPGSTVWQVYGSTNRTNRVSVADTFDNFVGVPMARQAQKVYFNETGGDSIVQYVDINHPQQIGNLAAVGCFILLCPKANRTYAQPGGTDDFTALQSALASIRTSIGAANMGVVLWQECTDNWFNSAQDYLNYWNHYAPAVPSDVQLYFDAGMGGGEPNVQSYAQAVLTSTVRKPDVIGIDWYDSSFHLGHYVTYPTNDPKYPGIADIADNAGLPFAILEWGGSASASFFPTPAQWEDYMTGPHGILTVIQNRMTAGNPTSHVMYYGGAGPGNNDIENNTDFRILHMQDVYNLMTGGAALGGAGGGGGEFAQESALAITDGHSYAFAVGSGIPNASGGNTTIAGDSVTVTAHGGQVATATSTGGTGGTGSSNSTHFDGGAGGAGGGINGGGGGGGSSGGTASVGGAGGAGTSTAGGAGGTPPSGAGQGGGGRGPGSIGGPGRTPGGGGGGGGANGLNPGNGSDGQIILSSFVTHPGGSSSYALGPFAFAGTAAVQVSNYVLAPPHISATANVSMFSFVQQGVTSSGPFTLPSPSKANSVLVAHVAQTTQSQSTPPAGSGWQLVVAGNATGGNGRAEMWILPNANNPGGISSVSWSGGTNMRGYVSEYTCPPGFAAKVDGTPVAVAFGPGVTSFPISTSSSNLGGDMALAFFEDQFSVNPTGSTWTTPSGWTRETFVQASVPDCYVGYYKLGINSGTQSVTGTFSTSTSQTGGVALLATFTAVPLVQAQVGKMNLAGFGFRATGTAVVGPNQVQTNGVYALSPLGIQSPSEQITFPQSPLPIRVELLLNGAWTDISASVYQRDPIHISDRGRPNEANSTQPAQVTMTLNNRNGIFSPTNASGPYFPYLLRNTQIRVSVQNAVTPQGAWYTGYRFWGEVPAWPPVWDPSGSDVYVTLTCAGVLQRMAQSKTLGSPLYRYYNNLINQAAAGNGNPALNPAGYWPCEDAPGATQFSSGVPGGSPMSFTGGSPGLGGLQGDSNIPGSSPVAVFGGTTWSGVPGLYTSGGQVFDIPGTYQWTCPAGITTIKCECWGSGGGGANGNSNSGSGGGGGEYAQDPRVVVTPGKTYTLVVGAGGSGGFGSFSRQRGQDGNRTTFSGDSVTVVAHGGKGGTGSVGGAGGSGSGNAIKFSGGTGGSTGSGFGGCGGGSSAGNAANGNAGGSNSGGTGGNGANAPPGGGSGGAGGNGATANQGLVGTPGFSPTPPGGGGGGGGFNGGNNYGKPGGAGGAGAVQISFGTQLPTPPNNVFRFVIDVPATGGVDGANMGQILTSGTLASVSVVYHTGGNLALIGKSSGGTTLINSGSHAYGLNGQPTMVSVELTQQSFGGPNIKWVLTAITPNATSPVSTQSGTISGTLGNITTVNANNAAALDTGSGAGHYVVQYALEPLSNLSAPLAGYAGELAATRFVRLCGEQRIPAAINGSASDTPQMGVQPTDTLVNLLQDCENVDLGLMAENRNAFGLVYNTRASLQNQSPTATTDYSLAQLVPPLLPTDDDQLTRNDIVATRGNGSIQGAFYEIYLTTGTMSILDPPNGVGQYSYPVTVNVMADSQLVGFATWVLQVGTVDEYRYPSVSFDLRRPAVADGTFYQLATLDVGDLLVINNPPAWLPQTPINQLCFGFDESLSAFEWEISVNAVPASPYMQVPGTYPTW